MEPQIRPDIKLYTRWLQLRKYRSKLQADLHQVVNNLPPVETAESKMLCAKGESGLMDEIRLVKAQASEMEWELTKELRETVYAGK